MRKPPNPRPQARRYNCPRYDTCLEFAANLDWDSFHCGECRLSGSGASGETPGAVVLVNIGGELLDRITARAGAEGRTIEEEIISLVIAGLEEKT